MCVCVAHMAVSKLPRLVADPSLGVADMQNALESFLDSDVQKVKPNLLELVKPPVGVTWKSAVSASYLHRVGPLLACYLKKARNGVLPSKKNKLALARLDECRSLNVSRSKSREDWTDFIDEMTRMALSHVRGLKISPVNKERLWRKSDTVQQQITQDLLDLLVLPNHCPADVEGEPSGGNEAAEPAAALVPVAKEADDDIEEIKTPAVLAAELAAAAAGNLSPEDIFSAILAKQDDFSDGVVARSPPNQLPKSQIMSADKCAEKTLVSQLDGGEQPFMQGLMKSGLLSAYEVQIVESTALQEGPAKPKPKGKAKAKGKASTKKPNKKESTPQRAASSTDLGPTELETPTKPRSSPPPAEIACTPPLNRLKSKQCLEPASAEKTTDQNKVLKLVSGEKQSKTRKKTDDEIAKLPPGKRRKLLTSRAYHITYDQAVRNGKSPEEAGKLGRDASQKVRDELDAEKEQAEAAKEG